MAQNAPPDLPHAERPAVSTLARLWPFLAPYRSRLVLAFVFLCLAAGSTLVVPIAFKQLIDHGFSQGAKGVVDVNVYFIALFGVACVLAIATAMRWRKAGSARRGESSSPVTKPISARADGITVRRITK